MIAPSEFAQLKGVPYDAKSPSLDREGLFASGGEPPEVRGGLFQHDQNGIRFDGITFIALDLLDGAGP